MKSATCPNKPRLERFSLGDVSAVEADYLESHVDSCAVCAETLELLQAEDDLVAAMRAGSPILAEAGADSLNLLMSQAYGLHHAAISTLIDSHVEQQAGHAPAALEFLEPSTDPGELGLLGPHRIKRIIGQGGMGIVFEAIDLRLHRTVALKVILGARHDNERYQSRRSGRSEIVGPIAASEHRSNPRNRQGTRTILLDDGVCGRRHIG